ncbi:helix-turn-helix domain-containing protein [Endozoicomonas ascidiicola]|uniref:helix-turn-helix domain-containing protein n=1 Tax=Endozoicomonas ascidiicola TaxID=1698521 RepID=UPI00082B4195|nr:helix-turn-helix transcriptional regulator [Endozoicomonas ascidiicola]
MIRLLFRQFLDDKSFRERRKITLAEVSEETGIGRATITRVANTHGYNVSLDVIDSLCEYFDCSPGELLQRVKE